MQVLSLPFLFPLVQMVFGGTHDIYLDPLFHLTHLLGLGSAWALWNLRPGARLGFAVYLALTWAFIVRGAPLNAEGAVAMGYFAIMALLTLPAARLLWRLRRHRRQPMSVQVLVKREDGTEVGGALIDISISGCSMHRPANWTDGETSARCVVISDLEIGVREIKTRKGPLRFRFRFAGREQKNRLRALLDAPAAGLTSAKKKDLREAA